MPLDNTSLGLILTTAVPILGGAGVWIYSRYNERHKSTLDEYREIVEKLKADQANIRKEAQDAEVRCDRDLDQLRAELAAQRARQDDEYRRLADKLVRAQVQNQALRGELQSARMAEAAARSGQSPLLSPSLWAFCIIVTDENGVIIEANPGVNFLFHWSEEEVVGQNVRVLIPPRYQAAHDAGMSAVRGRRGVSQQGRVMSLFGLTREGEEIPVDLYIESWFVGGALRCGALVKRHWRSVTDAGLISNAELPAFNPGVEPGAVAPPAALPSAVPPPAPTPALAPAVLPVPPTPPALPGGARP